MNDSKLEQKLPPIKNKISRITLNDNQFTNIVFKTYIQNLKQNFIDTYSYLTFSLNSENQYYDKAFNLQELTKFINICKSKIDLIISNSNNLKNKEYRIPENLTKYQVKYEMPNAFNNEKYYVLISFNENNKMILDFMSTNKKQNGLIKLGSFLFLDFKAFIEELDIIKSSWFNLQNSNINIYFNLNKTNNNITNINKNDSNEFVKNTFSKDTTSNYISVTPDTKSIEVDSKMVNSERNNDNTNQNFSEFMDIYANMSVDLNSEIKNYNDSISDNNNPLNNHGDLDNW